MNLLERNNGKKENWKDEQWKDEQELQSEDDIIKDGVKKDDEKKESAVLKNLFHQSNTLTAVLLGVIVILLLCILILLVLLPRSGKTNKQDSQDALQQSITDYAHEQKKNDNLVEKPETGAIIVDSPDLPKQEENQTEKATEEAEEDTELVSEAADKTAIVVDVEDENDVSYTKEFILDEMLPYFEDNNLEAVWDLAHLKRYVKLSAGLENTDTYYYLGDVDSQGLPDGIGLAIYEKNTYYYGSWSHGVRSGDGRWYRFYIDPIGQPTTKKKYQAHSYSGQWANDLPNGEGAEHYDVDTSQLAVRERILQNVVGNFTNGLYDGELYANTVDYTGNVEEWSGTAHNGVFDLWRDMSAIGECSVWQKRDDHNVYMDIDKAENKNQGIRELLTAVKKQ